jgi:hypothetical protein
MEKISGVFAAANGNLSKHDSTHKHSYYQMSRVMAKPTLCVCDQHGYRPVCSQIRIHTVRLPNLLQVEKLIANSIDPDQIARMRRLVWIHAGRKCTMLVCRDAAQILFI